MKPLMTLERAREVFIYDPETGVITWARSGKIARAGAVAGHLNKTLGYRTLWLDGKAYLAHRVAWLLTHGVWPDGTIDHINGYRADNRLTNLRAVSQRMNNQNMRKPPSTNTSGYLGVTFCKDTKKWRSQIGAEGKHFCLGRYDTPLEAHLVYVAAKRRMHEGCTL